MNSTSNTTLLISGDADLGQTEYVVPALLHLMQNLDIFEVTRFFNEEEIVDVRWVGFSYYRS